MISNRIGRLELSPTLRINAKAKAMKAEGIDVIDFSVGEPDFPTPADIKEAGKKAIDDNFTKYTANDGIPELKSAIRARLKEDHGLEYANNEIIVSSGAKQGLYNLFMAILNRDEEVIIPAPYWVSYPQQVLMVKGKPVIVQTKEENGFRLTADELKANLNFNTKAIIINNPSNPTGAAYTREQLMEICEIAAEEGLIIVADEIYEKVIYDGYRFTSVASLSDKIKAKTVLINGVSKSYSMTGWRIGYAIGPRELISAMGIIQSHTTSNANSIAQKAAAAALSGNQSEINRMVAEFQTRRNYMMSKLNRIPNISCYQPQGAFYLFPNTSAYYNTEYGGMKIRNSYGLSYYLLKEAAVALVPGSAFGADDNIRLSYATSMDKIEKGTDRIIEAMLKLKESPKYKRVALQNVMTYPKGNVEIDTAVSVEERDALVQEAEANLPFDRYFEWNANINGIIIQLRTNVPHLYDFWVENWYPAQLESDLEPHGIIYAVDGVPGRTSYGYYCPEMRTAILFNTSYYGQIRSIALGMVAQASERLLDVHGIRAAGVDFGGKGLLLVGAKGMKRGSSLLRLLEDEKARFLTNDWLFVRYRGNEAIADAPERKFYFKTESAKNFPRYARIFDRSKCENVVTTRSDWTNMKELVDECPLDLGEPYCYWGSLDSRALVDPAWIGGPQKYIKRSHLKTVALLCYEPNTPAVEKLSVEAALDYVTQGKYRSASGAGMTPYKTQPFFNPYILGTSVEQEDLQRRNFHQLFRVTTAYKVNIASIPPETIKSRLRELV
ncbi:MAG: aminotransferase class I and II [candidate division Zixibacteria bacterium HGW-Zixibacteria-1]|nr:MAG: aminotransferase class I and II [candidate division Zixibacteria bacterium HGW-Zixibacteria-1]